MSATPEQPADKPVHLLVLVHGMWGNPGHLAEMDRIYNELRAQDDSELGPGGERLHTLLAHTNSESGTYDGIDWCGERIAQEVYDEVTKLADKGKSVTRISVTGYSLGGLIGRYLIGILHQRKFFEKVTPVNFTTVATPHIGLLVYPTFRSKLFMTLGPRLLNRTGKQFYAKDQFSPNGRSLVEVMADPKRVFYQALTLFPHIRFYANAVNDLTVPYVTAAVEAEDEFAEHETNGMTIELKDDYSPLIKSYSIPDTPPPPPEKPKRFSKKWFNTLQVPLPPRFRGTFPWNILIIVALPILIPSFITLALVRLSLDQRSSRSRIKLLEKDETYRERLAHVIGELEKRVEDVVVDYIEDPGNAATSDDTLGKSHLPASGSAGKPPSSMYPIITPAQRKMIQTLNELPNLQKERVYIHPVLNSHAVIIARDVKRFSSHKEGHGVLRHMADNFVM